MAKQKACKQCRAVYDGDKCPNCGSPSSEATESWKGKVMILHPEKSEIAKQMKLSKKGTFAIKTR